MKIHEHFCDFINERTIEYSAIVLTDDSREYLLSKLKDKIPEGWKIIAHHMTIAFRKGLDAIDRTDDKDKNVEIFVTHLGLSNKAMAVQVEGYPSTNKISHITIAINIKEGGKPVMSNDIKNWKRITKMKLTGVVTEILK